MYKDELHGPLSHSCSSPVRVYIADVTASFSSRSTLHEEPRCFWLLTSRPLEISC